MRRVFKLENIKYKLKKKYRLKSPKAFQRVYSTGKAVVHSHGVFYLLPSLNEEVQMGFAVGKKIGNAVVRNHVKRMMREVYRKKRPLLQKKVRIVWVARKRLAAGDLALYEQVFEKLAVRAGLW